MDAQMATRERNRKFKIVLVTMGLMTLGLAMVAWKMDLKEVYSTYCFFLLSASGLFFGANVIEKRQPTK